MLVEEKGEHMQKRTHPDVRKQARKTVTKAEGFLESAAQAIGSTLGTIALKTGIAKPSPTPKARAHRRGKPAVGRAAKTARKRAA